MLGGDDDRIDTLYISLGVIFDGDLRFSVGTKIGAGAIFPHFRKLQSELVGQGNREGHQFGSLVAGIAEHHSLIAGAAGVHTHGYVAGLFVDAGNNGASIGVETVNGVVIADRLDYSTDQVLEVDVGFGGDFAGDYDQAGAGQGLAGDAAAGIFTQACVQNGIGNLVGDFVGMGF